MAPPKSMRRGRETASKYSFNLDPAACHFYDVPKAVAMFTGFTDSTKVRSKIFLLPLKFIFKPLSAPGGTNR
jgi:hypothetical protein